MSVNNLSVEDCYQLINDLHSQATGVTGVAPTDLSSFISMANLTLAAGTDTVYGALMQMVGRTIFSVRPYTRRFGGLVQEAERWGAIKRKIVFADKDIQDAEAFMHPVDGSSVDPWKINKADVLEFRYYGSDVWQDSITVFEDQLRIAMESPEQLGSFVSSQMTHMSNKWEQYLENFNRMALCNMIAAKYSQTADVVHLLTEYNAQTGLSLTSTTVWQPGNMEGFFRWVRARINTIARRMEERSTLYQMPITGHNIVRHTPSEFLKIYLLADALDQIDTMVNTVTYHDEPLAYADVEGVSYWQAIDDPDEIQVTPVYIDGDGIVQTATAQTMTDVFGVMFDRDACATNICQYDIANSPYNARGRYFTTWLSARMQSLCDLSEKVVVLMLD